MKDMQRITGHRYEIGSSIFEPPHTIEQHRQKPLLSLSILNGILLV
jgi:hypothetical protein